MTTPAKTYPVRVETRPAKRVAYMRHVGPYREIGPTFRRFMEWAGRHGLFGPGTQVLGMAYDNPDVTPASQLRYDACVTVGDDFQPEGEVGVQTIPAGEFAIARLRGSYEELAKVYKHLNAVWLPASGRKPANGPMVEIYLNSPATVPEAELLTDVCMRLA